MTQKRIHSLKTSLLLTTLALTAAVTAQAKPLIPNPDTTQPAIVAPASADAAPWFTGSTHDYLVAPDNYTTDVAGEYLITDQPVVVDHDGVERAEAQKKEIDLDITTSPQRPVVGQPVTVSIRDGNFFDVISDYDFLVKELVHRGINGIAVIPYPEPVEGYVRTGNLLPLPCTSKRYILELPGRKNKCRWYIFYCSTRRYYRNQKH